MTEIRLRPIHRLLVANRGEVALRVFATARRMGIATVAVFSEADRNHPHVVAADRAICIGGAAPRESYLNIERIIDAARASGADAIHPGYGFLAENADFADAVVAAGLIFVGPPAAAMRTMGNKGGAKALMQTSHVPCLPGYQGADQSDGVLAREAARIGYPVMIKAAAGGGGRGMRLVQDDAGFLPALQSARSEAANAFGSAEVILEKAILAPRHVEVQVFADQAGATIHLGERDCSVQRRHQKLIEESPSPALDATLRAQMGAAAVAAAQAVHYVGAGTVEFLLDDRGAFYFMEMNTRLQVEHAVTETLAGLDLVEWQLRIAMGEPLPMQQDNVKLVGHAIEVRLCAEDPAQDFMPQTGDVLCWRAPERVRIDHGLHDGLIISPHYDSMVAKLIAHGPDRQSAIDRLISALGETALLGVKHNGAFLQQCLDHAEFRAGRASTAFIERHFPIAVRKTEITPPNIALALCALLLPGSSSIAFGGWSNAEQRYSPALFLLNGKKHAAQIYASSPSQARITLSIEGGEAISLDLSSITVNGAECRFEYDGRSHRAVFAREVRGQSDILWLHFGATVYCAEDIRWQPATRGRDGASDGTIRAALTGKVVHVAVQSGAKLAKGATIIVLEAMKMEHPHVAPFDGQVSEILVQPGTQVEAGKVIARLTRP